MPITKYNYNQFINLKNIEQEIDPILDNNIESIKKIINNSAKSYYDKNKYKINRKDYSYDKAKEKSLIDNQWRINKTIIKKNINTKIDKQVYEINSLLNKLSPKNYDNIIKQIFVYFNGVTDCINDLLKPIIDNIFLKAVSQPIYCPLYVRFIKLIDSKFNINILLKNKCLDYKKILEVQDTQMTKENLSEQELYDKFCEENTNKIFKTGYSQFIGELYNNNMIDDTVIVENIMFFVNNFKIVINNGDMDMIENIIICLFKLIITTHTNLKLTKFSVNDNITNIYNNKSGLCKRLQFKIDDIKDFLLS
jgi:hypothetical protein